MEEFGDDPIFIACFIGLVLIVCIMLVINMFDCTKLRPIVRMTTLTLTETPTECTEQDNQSFSDNENNTDKNSNAEINNLNLDNITPS